MAITVGLLKETRENERRVALVPLEVKKLTKKGFSVMVERGAGEGAYISDEEYSEAGATLADRKEVLSKSDIVVKVQPPDEGDIPLLREGSVLVSLMFWWKNKDKIKALAGRKATVIALERVPRTTKAQFVDVLSSQATVSGYKVALLAADLAPRLFPMMTTAAGTLKPARVLVIGVGVAGLQALATAKRLGARIYAYDIRPAAKKDAESVGAKFLESPVWAEGEGGYARELTEEEKKIQREFLAQNIGDSDVVITTAAVPGRPAPKIIFKDMVERMKPGSVIVDLGAENGGNCELTKAGETVVHNGVIIHGPVNVPSMMPIPASQMFSRNIYNLLEMLVDKEGNLQINPEDPIVGPMLAVLNGEIKLEM